MPADHADPLDADDDRRDDDDRRAATQALLSDRAFVAQFQPIVDLATGFVVGYEAFTQFMSGRPASAVFADARAVGLEVELEIATLRSVLVAARGLPGGRWLDLNVSTRLLDEPSLWSLVAIADRRLHLEVAASDLVTSALALAPVLHSRADHVGLAVVLAPADVDRCDDGMAPDLFKLDPDVTRRAGSAEAGAALAAMRQASVAAAVPVVAEGVDAPDQGRRLAALGVEYGQGRAFGGPVAVTIRPSVVN